MTPKTPKTERTAQLTPDELEENREDLEEDLQSKERGVKAYQRSILSALVLIFVLWLLFYVAVGLTHMPSGDMYPRIDAGDFVMFYRLDKTPKFQDVIVYEKVDSQGVKTMLISRVIAAPGDTVEITEEGAVLVNHNALSEPNIFYIGTQYRGETAPEYPLKLGDGEYFVLGDRRDIASDSRSFGPVHKSEILGTVITILRRMNL